MAYHTANISAVGTQRVTTGDEMGVYAVHPRGTDNIGLRSER